MALIVLHFYSIRIKFYKVELRTVKLNTISNRIKAYFGDDVENHFRFGSSTRDTILPRKNDEHSDIDYMVIFNNPNNYKPQTLLNWLKEFAEKYYSKSEIHQSHPTMVLELSHIKFELVPSIQDYWGTISIPSPLSDYSDWITTDPNGFNEKLSTANEENNFKIKPLVRLMKYWNVKKASRGFPSYMLEEWIVDRFFYNCINIKQYLFSCIDELACDYSSPQYLHNAESNAKTIVANVKHYENTGQTTMAESEIKKLIPTL